MVGVDITEEVLLVHGPLTVIMGEVVVPITMEAIKQTLQGETLGLRVDILEQDTAK